MSKKPILAIRLDDEKSERVRRNIAEVIDEMRAGPAASAIVISSVTLKNGVATKVAHPLGRAPQIVLLSPPRGAVTAGLIVETQTGDRSRYVVLTASGYGATVVVDVVIL